MVNLPTAVQRRKKFVKNSINVTTNDYLYNKPVYSRELMANQSTSINMSVFSRLFPMQNPAYARCKFINRAYFVPYRTIFPSWNRFLSQEKAENGRQITEVHQFNTETFYGMLHDDAAGSHYFVTPGNENSWDISYLPYATDPGMIEYYKFTKRGKVAYDTLINLGYNLPYEFVYTPEMTADDWSVNVSALPLLAYVKVWFDWYRNNKYEPLVGTDYVEAYFYATNNYTLDGTQLRNLLLFCTQISYPIDYFTSAGVNPVTPNIAEPNQQIQDVTLPQNSDTGKSQVSFSGSSSKTPNIVRGDGTSLSPVSLTDYILKALNKMTDYMVRDGLVGGKTLDRLLAHYGVRLESEQLKRSVYLGKYEQPITIMDVTQTSPQTSGPDQDPTSVLGYQAGRGVTMGDGNGHFEFETKEFGQMIIISQLVPEVSYYSGMKREMLHIKRFDFFTPEYDALGPQAIAVGEIYNGPMQFIDDHNDYRLWYNNKFNDIFGYAPSRYIEYKHSCNQDVLSGDFRVRLHGMQQLQAYHQFRQILDNQFENHKIKTCLRFDSIMADQDQYDRIFNDQDATDDHFISFYDFQVTDYMPCEQAFDGYDFGDDEEHRLHQTVAKGGTMF